MTADSPGIERPTLADLRQRFGVFGLSAGLAFSAIALDLLVIQPRALPPSSPILTWWMLAGLYALTAIFVVHLAIGRETHSFSLNEIPLVLGLFLAGPIDLVVGQLVGTAVALAIHRRQPIKKLAFNLASFAFSTSVALLVFLALVDPADPLGPRGWVGAFAAALTADLVSAVTVQLVIAASTGERPTVSGLIGAGGLMTLANATLGLVAVLLLTSRAETAWMVVVLTCAMYLAYRVIAGEREKHQRLLGLHEATRDVQEALSSEAVTGRLLHRAREMFGAEAAELLVLPSVSSPARRTRTADGVELDRQAVPLLDPTAGVWARVASEGAGVRLRAADAPERLRQYLQADDIRDLMAAPVRGESGVVAVLTVMNRVGSVGGWRADEMTLFETLANHAGVALRNEELVEGLAARASENEYQARHDALTGLPNRTWFHELVDRAIAGEDRPAALLTLDLDGFKEINDTLGHQNGDRILRDLATRLRTATDARAIVCRLSGDEFAMTVFGESTPTAVRAAAERMQATLEEPFSVEGLLLNISGSIGVAMYPVDGADAATLLRHADVAMYHAKIARSGCEFYDRERDEYSPARLALVGQFRRAMEVRELVVWFQPKVDLGSGRIVGAEALVRWQHPARGLVFPDAFIPVVEQTNLLRPMTLYVLEAAIGRCAVWRAAGLALDVAVNLSARNLLDLQLPTDVARLLAAAGLPASALRLEITESAMMADPARADVVLRELRSTGVGIAIDDFGTGHASLAYLKRLPVDELKIDRSFVMALDSDEDDRSIVRSTIDLAHDLGLTTVAEGVENAWIRDWLAAQGCDLAQGRLTGMAVPSEDFERLVARNAVSLAHPDASADAPARRLLTPASAPALRIPAERKLA